MTLVSQGSSSQKHKNTFINLLSSFYGILFRFALLLVAGASFGFILNLCRKEPLSWVYLDPEQRLQQSVQSAPTALSEISIEELKGMMVQKENVLLIDARSRIFYQAGHLPEALNLPQDDFERGYNQLRDQLQTNGGRKIIVYCSDSDCHDSEKVAVRLVKAGIGKIAIFSGGYEAWKDAGQSIAKEKSTP